MSRKEKCCEFILQKLVCSNREKLPPNIQKAINKIAEEEELQIEAEVPLHERFRVVQSYSESSTEAIILKNVAKEGFATFYRMDVMPLKFAELAVQQLARFHGLSFVIQQKRPEYFERKIKTLKQSLKLNDDFRAFCRTFFNYSVEGLDSELVEGEVTEVIPVDYQLLTYGAPITNFLYFIYGATDKEFRRNHLIHLKDIYFETTDNFPKYFEMDIGSVYSTKEFERDYVECLGYGLQFMLFIFPLVFTLESDVPDLG
ncbi:unnamed protein product [Parnassius apollo]|uniref:(apollo) hypothetical protein n=1 Tax=Parnassius apollo TaxID=110799 RepID=A0A8S3W839_PARAO|nr:unnamed protein product [Parnassius apollo]